MSWKKAAADAEGSPLYVQMNLRQQQGRKSYFSVLEAHFLPTVGHYDDIKNVCIDLVQNLWSLLEH